MKVLFRVLRYAKSLWPYYLGVTALTVVLAVLSLATPFLVKGITDVVVNATQTGQRNYTVLWFFVLGILAAEVIGTLLNNVAGYLGDMMSAKLRAILSDRYFKHLLTLPQAYFDRELTGTIINRLNRTIMDMTQFLNMFANNFFPMVLTVLLSIGVIAFYSWQLALLVSIIYPLFIWLTSLSSKRWQAIQTEKNDQIDRASGRFAEVVGQMRVVKSFIRENFEYARFSDRFTRTIDLTTKQSKHWHSWDIGRRLVLNIIFFLIYAYIAFQTLGGGFTIGIMVLLIQIIAMVSTPIFSMSFIIDAIQRAIAGSKDYFEAMEEKPDIVDEPDAKKLTITKANVSYQHITFGYDSDESVLEDVTFDVKQGQKVALVAESGGGKTTLTNLLLRLYQPDKGVIMIDDQDIATVTQRSLRENIAVVFQEPALFSGTVRETITYGNESASQAEIEKAAKAANAHDFIMKLDHGYDTQIGEKGVRLSGGQKQRLAIARAVLKDAPILVLDEATSSLDNRSEHLVQQALDRLMKRRSTIIVAHRLSTIAAVDKIVTLKNGRVDEVGTPNELAQTGGLYAQLLQLQADSSKQSREQLAQFDISHE